MLRCAVRSGEYPVSANGLQEKRAVVILELFPLVGLLATLATDKRNCSKNVCGNGCRPKA